MKTAAILCTGNELTNGSIINTNASYIAKELKRLGIETRSILTLPDDYPRIMENIKSMLKTCDYLFITGGLGPTSDDLTREALSSALNIPLIFSKGEWEKLIKKFPKIKKLTVNKKQALVPKGFKTIDNDFGSAPGLSGSFNGRQIYCLPGPPRELNPMFDGIIKNDLNQNEQKQEITFTCFLIPESQLEETLLNLKIPGLKWSTRFEEYRLLCTLFGVDKKKLLNAYKKVKSQFDKIQIHEGEIDPAEHLFKNLLRADKKLVLAESCTGGLLGELITEVPGSSQVFWGGFIVYSNEAKIKNLGVLKNTIRTKGAVSKETAGEMALCALQKSGADLSLAITGIAGPSGGSKTKPVGTVFVACAYRDKIVVNKYIFSGGRRAVRRRAAVAGIISACKILESNT